MSFFSELSGREDSKWDWALDKIMSSVQALVLSIDAKGKKNISLYVVYNSYDNDFYCILASAHDQMISKPGYPSLHLGSFEMEKLTLPMNELVKMIKQRLRLLGSENNSVSISDVPIYGHPDRGIFDKRADFSKIKSMGYGKTIRIDINW